MPLFSSFRIYNKATVLCCLLCRQPNYDAIMKTCHLWRNYEDIQDSWESVTKILNYYGDNQNSLIPLAGPGHWNDPDMVN